MTTFGLAALLAQADAAARRRLLRDFHGTDDPAHVACIAERLGDDTPAVCEAAVDALVRCGGDAAAAAAAGALAAENPAQRGYAVDVLVRLGPPAVPRLAELLKSPDHDVRKYSAEALAAVGDAAALTLLIQALQDEDVTVAAAAAEALGHLGLPEAIPSLAAILTADARAGLDWTGCAVQRSTAWGRSAGEPRSRRSAPSPRAPISRYWRWLSRQLDMPPPLILRVRSRFSQT